MCEIIDNDFGYSKPPPIQDDACPVMVGCDVVGLYPNLDPLNVASSDAQGEYNEEGGST